MPDKNENLYLFEAIELRNEYDRQIKLLENLLVDDTKRERFFRDDGDEEKEPVEEFNPKEIEGDLKKLQTKRVKLNQAIQVANFKHDIEVEGGKISIAEALEIRKNILTDLDAQYKRVINSAYKRIIHKEERDIVREPKQRFKLSYDDYMNTLKKLRLIINQIHIINHTGIVDYREE